MIALWYNKIEDILIVTKLDRIARSFHLWNLDEI